MGSALARIVAVHVHRQQEQQSGHLAPHCSKEGLLLLLDDKVGATGPRCCLRHAQTRLPRPEVRSQAGVRTS